MKRLEGKVALVTGASSGIGKSIAVMLASLGANLVLTARREALLEQVRAQVIRSGVDAICIPADLADVRQLNELVAASNKWGAQIDILVNSAGVANALRPVHLTDMVLWDAEMTVNLRAPAALCAAVLPGMRDRRFGFVVNICSEAGASIIPGMGAYCVSKHALRVLTELIQEENQSFGIKAWAICPGEVSTPMADFAHGRAELFLQISDVVEMVRFLFEQGDNVKMGPTVLIRTMRDPFEGSAREIDRSYMASDPQARNKE